MGDWKTRLCDLQTEIDMEEEHIRIINLKIDKCRRQIGKICLANKQPPEICDHLVTEIRGTGGCFCSLCGSRLIV